MTQSLKQYLLNRGLNINDRAKPLEITDDKKLLTEVAGAWSANKEAIRLVVRARCDKIREDMIFNTLPHETIVKREALMELAGILHDFENISEKYGDIKETEPEQDKEGAVNADTGT
jgi:hypothetical protein